MAKDYKYENFTMLPETWFKNYWGFIPTEEDFKTLDPGGIELLFCIFSDNRLQAKQNKEMNKFNGNK